jgi:hypothetical protein
MLYTTPSRLPITTQHTIASMNPLLSSSTTTSAPYPTANGGLTNILDHITLELIDNEEVRCSPAPICPQSQIMVVPKLSVRDNLSLCNSDFVDDVITLLLKKKNIDKKRHAATDYEGNGDDPSTRSTNNIKRRHTSSPRKDGTCSSSSTAPFSSIQQKPYSEETHQDDGDGDSQYYSNNTNEHETASTLQQTGQKRETKWSLRFQDLLEFKATHGHCSVPNIYPSNSQLAQWVKRQRYQYKLKMAGTRSTLTDERQRILEEISFVWHSHTAAWMERWSELYEFRQQHGHSNVPSNFEFNRHLSIWVKCQRRQYKLYRAGEPSNMTIDRIQKLNSLEFNWDPRNIIIGSTADDD